MKQNPDFQYIAEILDDYCDIHSDGLVGEPLEYSEDSVREQIGLLKGFSADLEQREEDATRYVREDIYLALQAQVEQLRKQKEQLLLGFDEYKQMQNIADAEIKAQAVSEVWKHFNGKFRQNEKLTVMEVCVMLNNHVGYLRQQAKAGDL